jgi:BclB C-terminal domain-containing protein
LAVAALGAASTPAYVAFGLNVTGIEIFGNPINITSDSSISDFAFTVPRDGTITDITSTFIATAALSLAIGQVFINCQLYSAAASQPIFTPIAATRLQLTPGLSTISIGTVVNGALHGLSVPVSAGTQLMMVFAANNSSAQSLAGTVIGYTSASVAIA